MFISFNSLSGIYCLLPPIIRSLSLSSGLSCSDNKRVSGIGALRFRLNPAYDQPSDTCWPLTWKSLVA